MFFSAHFIELSLSMIGVVVVVVQCSDSGLLCFALMCNVHLALPFDELFFD